MGLVINQTYAAIKVETTPSELNIDSEAARLELKQKQARVNIHTELPRVEIDQYECFATAGLKNVYDMTKEAAQRGISQAMEYIAKMAGDGDAFAAIEQSGNPIADIAVRDSVTEHEFGLDFIPKARPKITVKGGVQIDPERNSEGATNGVEGTFRPGYVKIDYTPAKVSIGISRYNSINISVEGKNVNTYV